MPPDGGIVYTETGMHRLIPEPLNTITAGFFIVSAIYWLIRLNGFSLQSIFLSIASYILLIGSIGGTAYHGLRMYKVFILMDWVPILLLCMAACAYFWAKILSRRVYAIVLIVVFFLLQFAIRYYMEQSNHLDWGVSINYALMAVMVIAPVLIYLFKTGFIYSTLVFTAIACFALALFFRVSDNWNLLQAGTQSYGMPSAQWQHILCFSMCIMWILLSITRRRCSYHRNYNLTPRRNSSTFILFFPSNCTSITEIKPSEQANFKKVFPSV